MIYRPAELYPVSQDIVELSLEITQNSLKEWNFPWV